MKYDTYLDGTPMNREEMEDELVKFLFDSWYMPTRIIYAISKRINSRVAKKIGSEVEKISRLFAMDKI